MNTRKSVSGKARKPFPAAPKKGAPAASAKGKSAASAKNAKPTRPAKDVPAKKSSAQPTEKEVSARDKRKYIDFKEKVKKGDPLPSFNEDEIRLNKYLSNAGICSRREADVLIQTGVVSINGEIITELGYKIKPGGTL